MDVAIDGADRNLELVRHGDKPIKAAGVWDRITPTSCRWRQSISHDGGKTWEGNWIMEWTRV